MRVKGLKKKMFGIIMSVCMILSLMPATAGATVIPEEEENLFYFDFLGTVEEEYNEEDNQIYYSVDPGFEKDMKVKVADADGYDVEMNAMAGYFGEGEDDLTIILIDDLYSFNGSVMTIKWEKLQEITDAGGDIIDVSATVSEGDMISSNMSMTVEIKGENQDEETDITFTKQPAGWALFRGDSDSNTLDTENCPDCDRVEIKAVCNLCTDDNDIVAYDEIDSSLYKVKGKTISFTKKNIEAILALLPDDEVRDFDIIASAYDKNGNEIASTGTPVFIVDPVCKLGVSVKSKIKKGKKITVPKSARVYVENKKYPNGKYISAKITKVTVKNPKEKGKTVKALKVRAQNKGWTVTAEKKCSKAASVIIKYSYKEGEKTITKTQEYRTVVTK